MFSFVSFHLILLFDFRYVFKDYQEFTFQDVIVMGSYV